MPLLPSSSSRVPLPRLCTAGLQVLFILTMCAWAPSAAHAQPVPPGTYVAPEDAAADEESDEYLDTDPSALTDFRSTLDPHGTWTDDPTYGQLWVPNAEEVGPNFAPYVSEGSWAYDEDYVWVSYYEWGWVPFHYGRWAWTGGRWGWVPGRVYAGAWVGWRVGSEGYGYVGWGPLAPTFAWRSGVAFGLPAEVALRPGPAVFVPRDALFAPRVAGRILVGDKLAAVAPETRLFARPERIAAGRVVGEGTGAPARGPSPATLGIAAAAVTPVERGNLSVARARAFGRPSSAAPVGARPPTTRAVRRGAPPGGARSSPVNEAAPRAGGARVGGRRH